MVTVAMVAMAAMATAHLMEATTIIATLAVMGATMVLGTTGDRALITKVVAPMLFHHTQAIAERGTTTTRITSPTGVEVTQCHLTSTMTVRWYITAHCHLIHTEKWANISSYERKKPRLGRDLWCFKKERVSTAFC